jgi:hypothetical protein
MDSNYILTAVKFDGIFHNHPKVLHFSWLISISSPLSQETPA